ncbi:Uncharacterised protein [uncultured Eubacterium sp.]|jgi:hypothetical protein|nr:Uncharacterised protein [uncultured Eubacterium sp.]
MMKQFFMKSERIYPLFIDILMDIIYYLYMILFYMISALNDVKINAMKNDGNPNLVTDTKRKKSYL